MYFISTISKVKKYLHFNLKLLITTNIKKFQHKTYIYKIKKFLMIYKYIYNIKKYYYNATLSRYLKIFLKITFYKMAQFY